MQALKINFQITNSKEIVSDFFYNNLKDVWFLNSNIDSHEVRDHWNSIKETLSKAKDKIKGISKVNIIVYDTERIPSVIIPPDMSRFLGEIKADIFIISEDKWLLNPSDEEEYMQNSTFNSPIINKDSLPNDFFKK